MSRTEFTAKTKDSAHKRSGGICECHRLPDKHGCGQPLGPGNTFYEHIIPCEMGGDNSLDNAAVLTKTCWQAKTATYDLPTIAKGKRIRRGHAGIRNTARPMPCGRNSPFKKRMSGEVVRR